jgi:hypothetical protein
MLHFLVKFRLATIGEFGRLLILLWAPPLLLSLLTFPFEFYRIIEERKIIDIHYAYEIACVAFNMKYDQLHFGYRIRYYEKDDL